MAKVVVNPDGVVVELGRKEKFVALRRGDVDIPLANVLSVVKVDSARAASGYFNPAFPDGKVEVDWQKGSFTRKELVGSFHVAGNLETFVAAYGDDPGYAIRTMGEPYELVVVSSDPVPGLDALVTGP